MEDKKVKTKDILLSLSKYAKENNASVDIVDFTLLKASTLIKTTSEPEYIELSEDIKKRYDTQEKMLDHHVEYKQIYIIKLFEKKQAQYSLDYVINFDDFNVKPQIIIKPSSNIPYKTSKKSETYLWLLKELNKIKVSNKILINLFDDTFVEKLKQFTKYVHAQKFTKPIALPLAEAIAPNITREGQLILHYENNKNEHGICEVDAGDKLVEFIKPKFGKNGINAFGDIVSNFNQNKSKDMEYEIDEESIEIDEDDNKKVYYSINKGYVNISKNVMYVDNTIKKKKLKRVQDALSEHEDNDIKVIVSEKDATQDSIGEGVELTSETIHVEGFVGSNSILNATHLIIDGATHQSSHQSAKYAKINRHKGTIRAHKVDIKLLEGGTVYATTANIDDCLNGTIYANDVNITNVKSNLKVYASNSITITLVSGEDNLFNIDYKKIPILSKKLEFIEDDLEDLKYHLEEAKRHTPDKIDNLELEIQKLKDAKDSIHNSIHESYILIKKPLRGLNTVTFTLSDLKEIIYKTDSKKYEKFYLEIEDETVTLQPVQTSIDL